MVVPPSSGGAAAASSASRPAAAHNNAGPSKAKSAAHTPSVTVGNAPMPLSARRSEPLDLNTVERRGQPNAAPEITKRNRLHGILEGPTFRPTEEEFRDPMAYMRKIEPEGRKYGIAKIIPPDGWQMPFAIDTSKFHFRVRRQELNSVEGGTRANLNYLDQLSKFHRQHGTNLNRFPSVDKRPLDLYKLKKAVEARGGFERVCKQKKWAEIGRDLGYSGKIMSSLSTSLKNSYQKWLQPYEDYLRVAKPGVQHQLELENGGPFTPSPGTSPLKISQNNTPNGETTPAMRASALLNASLDAGAPVVQQTPVKPTPPAPAPAPAPIQGFTPVNGGFTSVNRPSGFTPVNGPNGIHATPENPRSIPKINMDSPRLLETNTPTLEPTNSAKRPLGDGADKDTNGDVDGSGRRSKRIKREPAPTVAGSHMHQPRTSTPRFVPARERSNFPPGEACETCAKPEDPGLLLICDSCDCGYHGACLEPPVKMSQPENDWHCPRCLVGTGEFGFEEGEVYSLRAFQERANRFKENHFAEKMPFDPILNKRRAVNEDDVEREFWRLVENITETVEVEYGADIHSTTHGSGFPTIEKQPRDAYSTDPWNLNVLPLYGESLFKHIKTDISGMTVPWLYVGMVFSTFCWHNEDHYAYSANYQHFGATKTWYGVPGEDAEKFENAMREAVPELFETQPDLLFQLVTLMPPEKLQKAGVRVYAIDQRAGQMVVTFPQAYHAGFNHGFNLNEAVNFAPVDWEPFGESGVQRLRDYRRQPCFSHDELLLTAASRDQSINTAKWLAPALERLLEKELAARKHFLEQPDNSEPTDDTYQGDRYTNKPEVFTEDMDEEEYVCSFCKCYSFLSRYVCQKSGKVMCLLHAGAYECCDSKESDRYSSSAHDHILSLRMTDKELKSMVQKVVDRAKLPEAWAQKVDDYLGQEPRPSLKILRSLLNEGERIPFDIPQLADLKRYVERCNEWVEEATIYITRKQQNRAKGKASRKKSAVAETEDRDKELRNFENMQKLLATADEIHFDCPEYKTLRERETDINDFKAKAVAICMGQSHHPRSTQEIEEVFEVGKGLNIDLPELENLEKLLNHVKWLDEAHTRRVQFQTLQDVDVFITRGLEIGIAETNPHIVRLRESKVQGELWETKAKEIMAVENVHYQQLDALSKQAAGLPVTAETLARVDAILKKQREAQEKILALYQQSKSPDFRSRPMYKDVRDVMAALEELNSKPAGTVDLEKEQRRHEDWMRRGKKLFGKANAPLHILHQHMNLVKERNDACFELRDKPRMPVEPSSREHTPEADGKNSFPDVFCLCRRPEAGMMIECELCHEWYHGKCLKIARGKVKEDDKYTCPICDWRLKIPRDAARPKLEELISWQDELESLPFQPEEEDTLTSIIETAQAFRDYIRPYVNPLTVSPDEVTTLRFYLRKVEGADILLAYETNFLRQELHKSAPVAPEAPPVIDSSASTRKPRPTKQQKLMASLGITNPDDLPPQYKIKPHKRKGSEAHHKPPQPLQPAGSPAAHTPSSISTATPGPPSSRPSYVQHTPSFSYPSQSQPMATSGFRDSPLFAPSSFGLPPLRTPTEPSHTVNPAQFASHSFTSRTSTPPQPNFSIPPPPEHPPMFSTGMNLDPALFTAGGAMFDKRPSSSGSPRLVHPEASPVFSSPRTSEKHANLDSIFADMVHNDDDHATLGHEGENQLAGEAFAAGGHDQDHPDEAHMDEFVNNE
ncbi:PLU-1-domain-containing protein [Aureobasidium pullulans EXF-150]|uniref:PLU-1-domain-containing protein n=1 Tax=Aureobasidium pullulans EXF-150 TaxID=1043002 RepID=A0A074XXM9_AURPU|nr:PLU-1-domain-containing protein [Aureobasidium pullulans EXF-150]KEQ86672.1 PLU-1-domain-containing protein [Aureobasidium pullulans EXF-150]